MKFLDLFKERKKEIEDFVSERRRAKRYNLPLKLNYSDPITKQRIETQTKNICKTGIRFPVKTKILKGTTLDLELETPYGGTPVSSKAKVMWAEEFIVGDDAEDLIYEVGVKLLKKCFY
ncbi:PilZ domain-containing protein [Candidatus Omnitrophota bacterium]